MENSKCRIEDLVKFMKQYEKKNNIEIFSKWSNRKIKEEEICKEILFDNFTEKPRENIKFLKHCREKKTDKLFNLIKKFINIQIYDQGVPLSRWYGIKSDILINTLCIFLYEKWIYNGDIIDFSLEEIYETIELLIYFNADINKPDRYGMTAQKIIKREYIRMLEYKEFLDLEKKQAIKFIRLLKFSNPKRNFDIQEIWENTKENIERFKYVKKCCKLFEGVNNGRIIARAIKKALNDEFIITKLRFNIDKRKFLSLKN